MKKYSGFTLLEILLYVVIGGVTLVIAVFSFAQLNRLSTSFRVNNELNQTANSIIGQIQNLANETDNIISPKLGANADDEIILRKDNIDTTIKQDSNNITVSYSNGDPSYNLNPTGILVVNTTANTLSFEQIDTQDNSNNKSISQSIKLKFTLRYNEPAFSSYEYEAEKAFETTINLSKQSQAFEPILNTYPTGANGVAYGLRKLSGFNTNPNQLSSAYNGPAIRVRRGDSTGSNVYDNAEMDIGFNSKGELDQVALQNFVGYQNFLNYSEDITTTGGWSLNNITSIPDNTLAPDGTNTAEKINLSIGNNNKSIAKNTSIVNGSTYTDSYYIRAKDTNNDGNFNNDDNFVQIATSTGFSNSTYQNYNLKGIGTLANKSNDIAINQSGITKIGNNGWYRIWLTANATSPTSSGGMILSILNSDTSSRLPSFNITSDTDSIFVWGAMRHLNTSLTSPPKIYNKTNDKITSGDGYVTTWYDQSGNKNNAIQATTVAQPKIVDGVNGIIKLDNKPVLRFDGTDDALVSSSFNNATNSTAFFIASRADNNQSSFMARLTNYATLSSTDLFNIYYLNKSNTPAGAGAEIINSLNLYTAIRTSDINSTLAIGAGSAGNFLNGNMAELIIYDGDKSSNRAVIENNLRDYYGTQ